MIPEHKIEEVLERANIVQVVSRYVELKKSGRTFKGRCPFHNEKTPSFYVYEDTHRFKCFGCDAGGDTISFLQRYLGKTFVDTVKDLAREVGVDVESAQDPAARERQQIKEVTDLAARHFQGRLWDPVIGQKARAYLESRGVTEETSRAFGLGWAPAAWTDLCDALTSHGVLEWAVNGGLANKRQRGDGYFDTFRGRLMIPIRAPEGRTIAFGGRLLEGDDGPKYLNSKESRLYNKSETLYGLDQARDEIRRRKAAVLVEGYFDCIGLHQVGVKHAVALCSTALTSGHLSALSRCEAKELILLLDGDEAGRKAVERLAGPLLAQGASAKVALLPEGEDPDTFARKVGVQGVLDLLSSARPLTQHLFDTVLPDGAQSSFEDKMKALDRLKPITALLPVGLTRSAFFGALSAHSGLPAMELESALRGKAPAPRPVPKPEPRGVPNGAPGQGGMPAGVRNMARPGPTSLSAARPTSERTPDPLESAFVAAVLRDVRLAARDTFRVADQLLHPGLRAAVAHVMSGQTPEDALFEASEPVKRALETAVRSLPPSGAELDTTFARVCGKLKLRRIDERLSHIAKVCGQLPGGAELTDDIRRLIEERVELLALKKRVLGDPGVSAPGTKRPEQPV